MPQCTNAGHFRLPFCDQFKAFLILEPWLLAVWQNNQHNVDCTMPKDSVIGSFSEFILRKRINLANTYLQ